MLGQPHQQWGDIAMLMTANVIVLLGSMLYLIGRINPKKIKTNCWGGVCWHISAAGE
ncbi:MAG TPA: hypothetical protein VFZ76_03930 [Anaerolineales bacterium]